MSQYSGFFFVPIECPLNFNGYSGKRFAHCRSGNGRTFDVSSLHTHARSHIFLFRMAAASAAFLLLHVVMARCVCRVRVVEVAAGLPLQLLVVVVVAVVAAAANAVVQLLHSLLPFCLSVAVCDRLQIPPRSSDLSQKLSRRLKKMPSLL